MQHARAAALALSCLVLAAFSNYTFAQTTGDIRGTVTDSVGAPLPGATVGIRSQALQGTRMAVTEASGVFRFPLVPPGSYRLTAALQGFNPEERKDVRVGLGETTTVPITLVLATTAAVEVVGEVPLVDTTSTKIGTSVSALSLAKLPLGRNFSDAMLTLVGSGKDYAVCNCDPSKTAGNTIYGVTSLESGYIIDGLNSTALLDGSQGKQLNLEFVQEVEVRTGGYEAEYGKAMGASINVITKSGGNAFHGDVFGYYDSGSLAASDQHADERAALNLALPEAPRRYDAGLNLGGYLLKDTLWFFGAYDRVANDMDYQRVESLTYTPTSVVSNYVDGTDVRRTDLYSGKLTLLAGPSHTFVASVFGDPTTYDGRQGAMPGPASAVLRTIENGGTDVVARWEGVFGAKFLGQAQYGYHEEANSRYNDYSDQVRFNDNRRGMWQAAPGSGPGNHYQGKLRRNSWGATGAAFLGSHELKGGLGYELLNSSWTKYFSGGGLVYRYLSSGSGAFRFAEHDGFAKSPPNCQVRTDGSRGNFGFVDPTTCNGWEPAANQDASPRTQNLALFLQDSWKVLPNLTVNAGLRYESQRLYDDQHQPRIELANQWSPRVGVVWDPLANGRSKVYASYGRYYQAIPQAIQVNMMASGMITAVLNYTPDRLDFVNDSSLMDYAYLGGSAYVPPGIKGIYQDEIIAGVEAEVWKNWSVGVKGIYRSLGRTIEDRCDVYDPRSGLAGMVPPEALTQCVLMNPGEGDYGQLSDPANPDCWEDYPASTIPKPCQSVRAERVFRGIEVNVKRRFSDRFQLQASYLYSTLRGNYDGFVNELYGQVTPSYLQDFDYVDTLVNAYGRLLLDRTHQVRLSGFYALPFGLLAGLNASFATGAPLSILGSGQSWSGYNMYLEPRGSWDQLPSTYNVDVHLEYPLRFGSVTVTPLLDVFNLTNVQTATDRGQIYNDQPDGNQSPPYTNPTVASFGKDIRWQSPRIVRLGARVSF